MVEVPGGFALEALRNLFVTSGFHLTLLPVLGKLVVLGGVAWVLQRVRVRDQCEISLPIGKLCFFVSRAEHMYLGVLVIHFHSGVLRHSQSVAHLKVIRHALDSHQASGLSQLRQRRQLTLVQSRADCQLNVAFSRLQRIVAGLTPLIIDRFLRVLSGLEGHLLGRDEVVDRVIVFRRPEGNLIIEVFNLIIDFL